MKTFALTLLCALALPLMAAVGDIIPKETLPTVWFEGEQPKAWPNDDVWVFECWATWCGPCIRAIPHMEEMWNKVKNEKIHIVGVNLEENKTPEQLRTFFAQQRVPPTYAMAIDKDNRFARKVNIIGIPHAVAVRSGKIVWQGHPMTLTVEKLRSLTSATPIAPVAKPTTKPTCNCPKQH